VNEERGADIVATPFVRIVVLNYNGGALVQDTVASLTHLDWPAHRLDIVVVDNASSDGSDIEVEKRFPRVRLVRSSSNIGFSANNLAMRDLDGVQYLGLVNNDATVESGWLRPLVETLENEPALGAACPRILLAPSFVGATITAPTIRVRGDGRDLGVRLSDARVDGRNAWDSLCFGIGCFDEETGPAAEPRFRWTSASAAVHVPLEGTGPAPRTLSLRLAALGPTTVGLSSGDTKIDVEVDSGAAWFDIALDPRAYDVVNNAGSIVTPDGFGADRGYLEPEDGRFDEPADVDAWCGAGVLLARRYLDEVGLFDDRFFLYYEDTDLSWRGRARGWRYRYVPDAVERHVHAASTVEGSPLFEYYVARNRLVMLAKNAPLGLTVRATAGTVRAILGALRHDVVRPGLRGRRPHIATVRTRARALAGFARLLPGILRERRANHDAHGALRR
jgi:GT2 family glycosyltransferase